MALTIDQAQGAGAWQRLLPAIAADIETQPLLTPGELRGITPPTLVVVGDRDPLVPVGQAWELSRQVRDGRLFVAPDSGHDVLTPSSCPGARGPAWASIVRPNPSPRREPMPYRRIPDDHAARPVSPARRWARGAGHLRATLPEEHLPLVAGTPGLRKTRIGRVTEALGGETDLMLVTFDAVRRS
jgi:acetyl esterase/lipase